MAIASCTTRPVESSERVQATGSPSAAIHVAQTPTPTPVPPPASALGYPWMQGAVATRLEDRFAAPTGFTRVALAPTSFGGWLRTLPLEADGTPVTSYRGAVVLPADHENLAAVVAIDVGTADLQQCADSVIRLHAEWLFARGRRDASYRAASGAEMPFERWAQGERMVPEGKGFVWTATGKSDASHASYRRWLDMVFAWANTGSLARDTERVLAANLAPGDFVVQPGGPGHAVLVLDEATAPDGRRALLLGQGFMPAQSFHVLRPSKTSPAGAWFIVSPGSAALDTPFWQAFPWSALHRFPSR